jgi:hypothetical protein
MPAGTTSNIRTRDDMPAPQLDEQLLHGPQFDIAQSVHGTAEQLVDSRVLEQDTPPKASPSITNLNRAEEPPARTRPY